MLGSGVEVGRVFARLGFEVDDQGAQRYERKLNQVKREANRGVKTELGAKVDDHGFARHHRHVQEAERDHTNLIRSNGRLRTSFGSVWAGGGAAFAAVGGAFAIRSALKSVTGAYGEAQVSNAKMEAQLKASNISYGAHAKHIDNVIQRVSKLAALDDEDLQDAFTNIVRATGDVDKALHGTTIAADLARAKHMDVAAAGQLVSKVYAGNVGLLRRMGIALEPVTTAQDKLKESTKNATVEQTRAAKAEDKRATAQAGIAALQRKFAGQAAAYGKTQQGSAERLSVAWENLREKLGQKLSPVLTRITQHLSTFVEQMNDGTGAGGRFARKVSAAWEEVKAFGGHLKDVAGFLAHHKKVVEGVAGAWVAYRLAMKATRTVAGLKKGWAPVVDKVLGRGGRGGGGLVGDVAKAAEQPGSSPMHPAYVIVLDQAPGGVPGVPGGPGGRAPGRVGRLVRRLAPAARALRAAPEAEVAAGAGAFAVTQLGTAALLNKLIPAGSPLNMDRGSSDSRTRRFAESIVKDSRTAGQAVDRLNGKIRELGKERDKAARMGGDVRTTQDYDRQIAKLKDLRGRLADMGKAGRGSSEETRGLQSRLEALRGQLDKLRPGTDSYQRVAERVRRTQRQLNDEVANSSPAVRAARAALDKLRPGTDSYQQAAGRLRSAQRHANAEMRDAEPAGHHGARGIKAIGDSAGDASDATGGAFSAIVNNANRLLDQLGDKKRLHFNATVSNKRSGQPAPKFARGGWLGARGLRGDDTELVAAAPGEAFLTHHQQGPVELALAVAHQLGLPVPPSLDHLFSADKRPHRFQSGGRVDIEPVPGFPGERANASILGKIAALAKRFPRLTMTDAYGQGHKSPGHTIYGTATDWAGPDRDMDAMVRYLTGQGYLVGYDGRFGSQRWPGHGPSYVVGANAHLHAELGGPGGALAAVIEHLVAPVIKGPAGGLRRVAQAASRTVTRRVNAFLDRLAPTPVAGGGGGGAGRYSKRQLAALWRRAGGASNMANLMAAIALAESGGDPNAGHQHPYHGLWQVGPGGSFDPITNARQAVGKLRTQGLGAWETYTNGAYRQFLQRGGRARRWGQGISRSEFPSFARKLWDSVKGNLFTSQPLPPVRFGGTHSVYGARGPHAYAEYRPGSNVIAISDAMMRALARPRSRDHDYALVSLLHEFAHVRQDLDLTVPEAEGGADLWAGSMARRALGGLGIHYDGAPPGYPQYVNAMRAERPSRWWLSDQFRHEHGAQPPAFKRIAGHQRGGRAGRLNAAWRFARKLWGAAKGFYPGSAMPPTSLGVQGTGRGRELLGALPLTMVPGHGSQTGRQGHRHVYLPGFLTSAGDEAMAETLLHEWAHAFQSPAVFGGRDLEREGGAQAFTRSIYGRVMRAIGIDPTARKWRLSGPGFDSYYRFAQQVTAKRGTDWVMRGQFAGARQRFKTGGRVSKRPPLPRVVGSHQQETTGPGLKRIRDLRAMKTDRNEEFDAIMDTVDDLERRYGQLDRKYGLTEEELVDPETGEVDVAAVKRRAGELTDLAVLRGRIEENLKRARDVVKRIVKTYRTIIGRLRASLRHAKGKDRRGIRGQITHYEDRLSEWRGKVKDAGFLVTDAHLDRLELGKEYAAVVGTQPQQQDAGGDTSTDTPADATEAPASPAEVARVALEQLKSFQDARLELVRGYGSNAVAAGRGDDGHAGLADALTAAIGRTYLGGSRSGVDALGGGERVGVTQNFYFAGAPKDAQTFSRDAAREFRLAVT